MPIRDPCPNQAVLAEPLPSYIAVKLSAILCPGCEVEWAIDDTTGAYVCPWIDPTTDALVFYRTSTVPSPGTMTITATVRYGELVLPPVTATIQLDVPIPPP